MRIFAPRLQLSWSQLTHHRFCVLIAYCSSSDRRNKGTVKPAARSPLHALRAVRCHLFQCAAPNISDFCTSCSTPVPINPMRAEAWYSRTVPMSWEVLVENVTDPSHAPHSHHGVIGAHCSGAWPRCTSCLVPCTPTGTRARKCRLRNTLYTALRVVRTPNARASHNLEPSSPSVQAIATNRASSSS